MTFVPSVTFGNIIEKLNEVGKFNKLNETLAKSGLNENLKRAGPFTVFAPLDDAFAAISAKTCLLYTSPSPRDTAISRMPSSA